MRVDRRAEPDDAAADVEALGLERQDAVVGRDRAPLMRTRCRPSSTPRHQARMPFWACRRFSASSKTTDCGPSITSAVTSSPRWAGRQCMKSASGRGRRHQPAFDLVGLEQVVAVASSSSPIETQQSVTTQSAPSTASKGSAVTSTRAPSARAQAEQLRRAARARAGVATLSVKSKRSAAWTQRGEHVVGVARPGDRAPGDRPAMLLEGQHVGHDLAGMRELGQRR